MLVPDPFEAGIVAEIYQSYVADKGLVAIATMLNSRGIPAPRGGVAWTKGTLWATLRNPLYKGTVTYGKARYSEIGKRRGKTRRPESDWVVVEDAAPAIIPIDLWNAAQAKHGTRKFGVGRPGTARTYSADWSSATPAGNDSERTNRSEEGSSLLRVR